MSREDSLTGSLARRWRKRMGVLGLLSALMLIYGSFVPLQYRPLEWTETIARWKSIPWYQLGIYSRADWIANGLLVVPISFLLAGAFTYRIGRLRWIDWVIDLFGVSVVLAFLVALVYGIELVQVWFPPRTVSWNDIVSGWIGAVVGVGLWILIGRTLIFVADWFLRIHRFEDRLSAFAILTCVGVFFYSVYPLDIVLSSAEWSEKLKQGRVHWGFPSTSRSNLEWLKGIIVSVLRMVPVGVLGLSIKAPRSRWAWILATGVFLELVQLPIFSKFSSLVDVFAGWLGGMIGVRVAQPSRFWNWLLERRWVWICGSVCWCGLLVAAFLGRSESWVVDPEVLDERWSGFFTYPLLRYYYTSEYSALTNLIGKLMSFALLGVFVAGSILFGKHSANQSYRSSILWALGISIALGLVIEISQIYLKPFIGDLTDVGIYATGASAGAWLMVYLVKGVALGSSVTPDQPSSHHEEAYCNYPHFYRMTFPFAKAFGLGSLVCGGIVAGLHPGWPWVQLGLVGLVSGLVYWAPKTFPWVFILSLVAGDAYPVTGQLVIQEYDSLLFGAFAGLSLAHWRDQNSDFRLDTWRQFKDRIDSDRLLIIGLSLLALSTTISMFVGILRLPSAPWGDQLSVYFTQWNAIRVGKGIFWGVVFAVTMIYGGTRKLGTARYRWDSGDWELAFLRGFSLAGFYVGVFVFLERALFPGLLNWSDVYRATGPFFTMHIGDQHLDGFLVLAFPWVWAHRIHGRCTRLESFFCAMVLVLLAYAAFSTMSRATLAMILLQVVLLVALGWLSSPVKSGRIGQGLLAGAIGCALATGVFMAMQTQAVRGRFASLGQDWDSRVKHWSMITRRGTSGIGGLSIGHGLGTLPSLVAAEFGRPVPPLSWRAVDEKGSRLGEIHFLGQWPIYLERWISKPHQEQPRGGLQLQVKRLYNRQQRDQSALEVQPMLVEKSMLESFGSIRLPAIGVGGTWGALGWSDPGAFGLREDLASNRGSWNNLRPWTAGLSVSGRGAVVIQSAEGVGDLGVNSTSSYPWFFTCDDHMVWRAKNFLVHAYYEQGLVGVLTWSVLILVGLWRGLRSRSIVGSAQAVSIVGFVGVGFFGTLIDTPWITAILLGISSVNWIRSDGIEYTEL